jgi:D-ribose pyranose/furanose isomerase RbsD
MKSHGLLHGEFLRQLALLGPDETFVLGHCGTTPALPAATATAPIVQPMIDLAIGFDMPRLIDVLDALWPEAMIDEVLCPDWLPEHEPELFEALATRVGPLKLRPRQASNLLLEASRARFVVRTGEALPLTLVMRSGAPWTALEESRRTGARPPARYHLDDEPAGEDAAGGGEGGGRRGGEKE